MIPVEFYNGIYYNFMLLMVFITFAQSGSTPIESPQNLKSKQGFGGFLVFFILMFMGTRPVSGYFIDMRRYSVMFEDFENGGQVAEGKDVFFDMFMQFCSQIMSMEMFFFVCAALFILPIYFACKRIFSEYWFYAFLITASSYVFWSSGVNAIRTGIGLSFCMLGIANHDRKGRMILAFILAMMGHKSMILLILAFVICQYYRNTKMLLYGWFASILLSLAFGGLFENIFLAIGLGGDDRLAVYFSDEVDEATVTYVMGFRWDFLLYSAIAVFAGWYFIIKQKFYDEFYNTLFGMFLMANAFWVLVIRANFSNRFAALSWFFMGLIVVYPMLKKRFFKNQHRIVGLATLLFFGFTYIMLFIIESGKDQ
ncbi:EpsG family protein [Flavobacterium silvaticum]|uniref:EpsG family protein n=1 Tax=Flavobacterium silvaticum TaxID=1852020 RepID=A0A972FPK0_9FLAO|nr:EpsG family protein [Flavobacterium silvaticum]NMH29508.1 EpsG family protein [Flavobacterium silvaticum]